ncbi:hypothetical protein [Leptothoe sp. PORK10 BA2]|uniref:hypothetical protein n=1 Tax=Leptothoe sp. PORK10 BA2 TaxID=3110254 RepID=UPI002B1F7D0A|nr:hypothetical protein [Leptothoe sp. PORK10 BA2]MEA5462214.1 hypothetical protein [Leptothoe sp. PORK10 BA2]
MSNFYRFRRMNRQFLALSTLVCLGLTSCTPREDCAFLNGALADGNSLIQELYEGNRGGPGYNQGIERQAGRVYFDISQVIDSLQLSDQRLKAIQISLVEAYQQASDNRYQAADLIANNPQPSDQVEADIRQLQLDSEENIGSITITLRKRCPLR